MDEFHFTSYAQEVIFGPGALSRLSEALDRLRCQRIVLCTNRSLRASGHVESLETALSDRLKVVYDRVQAHVPDFQVAEILSLVIDAEADSVIGLGGGSPIGMAKAVASRLREEKTRHLARSVSPTDQRTIPVVAIPTTYAGSEMTAVYGITHSDESPPRKVTAKDPDIAPKLVVYDPELTLGLSPEMTASTGINALAHCIEAMYSITRHPISTAAALSGVRHIAHSLLCCFTNGDDLEARTEMLLGAHLAGFSLASVSMGLHHGLCHVLGGTAGLPHGIANSIILPHAIRFNAGATALQLLSAAEAMSIPSNGLNPASVIEDLAQKIFDLVGQMRLPQRLRDAGVKESELSQLAQLAFQNPTVQNNPGRISDAAEIESLLREAW